MSTHTTIKLELIVKAKKEKLQKMLHLQKLISIEQNDLNILQSLEYIKIKEIEHLENSYYVTQDIVDEKWKELEELQLNIQEKIKINSELQLKHNFNLGKLKGLHDFLNKKQQSIKYNEKEFQVDFVELF